MCEWIWWNVPRIRNTASFCNEDERVNVREEHINIGTYYDPAWLWRISGSCWYAHDSENDTVQLVYKTPVENGSSPARRRSAYLQGRVMRNEYDTRETLGVNYLGLSQLLAGRHDDVHSIGEEEGTDLSSSVLFREERRKSI